jgi:hypothetical protein
VRIYRSKLRKRRREGKDGGGDFAPRLVAADGGGRRYPEWGECDMRQSVTVTICERVDGQNGNRERSTPLPQRREGRSDRQTSKRWPPHPDPLLQRRRGRRPRAKPCGIMAKCNRNNLQGVARGIAGRGDNRHRASEPAGEDACATSKSPSRACPAHASSVASPRTVARS